MAANRIAEFLKTPAGDTFEALALAAFAEAYESDPAVRQICAERGLGPSQVQAWRSIPAISPPSQGAVDRPAARAGHGAADQPGAEASATDLAALAFETAFRAACLDGLASPPVLSLIGGEHGAQNPVTAAPSTLVGERFGGAGSLVAADSRRVDVSAARSWLGGRQRDRRAALIVATDATLERLLGALERQDLRFQLAFGSRVVLMKESAAGTAAVGTAGEPARAPSVERLGLDPEALIRQHRWRGVPTACYGRAAANGGQLISAPHWLRFSELGEGRLGALDLTAIGCPFQIEIDALGAVESDGTRFAARRR